MAKPELSAGGDKPDLSPFLPSHRGTLVFRGSPGGIGSALD
jgi:hypothetical protein